MSYEIQGQVEYIGPTETFGTKGFTKREFTLLVEDGDYTNSIKFEFTGDKCDRLDAVKVGQKVTVKFSLTGRTIAFEPKLKSYTNLRAWYISSSQNSGGQQRSSQPSFTPPPAPEVNDEPEDDIPF